MKLLYVASNPSDEGSLNLDREITELQRQASDASTEIMQFIFLPNLKVEDLSRELDRWKPDILHFSAHGDKEALSLAREDGKRVKVTARALRAFLNPQHQPKLIYINACESEGIAEELASTVDITIGSTAPITNRAARTAAVSFYARLLSGLTVEQAFNASLELLEALEEKKASVKMFLGPGIDPASMVLSRVPRLVADFKEMPPIADRDGNFPIRFGVVGCPPTTTQIVFFSDDRSLIDDETDDLEGDLCLVVRGSPFRGTLWADDENFWEINGDFRLFAVGVTGDARTFSLSSTVYDAIVYRFKISGARPPKAALSALALLRDGDGTLLDPSLSRNASAKNIDGSDKREKPARLVKSRAVRRKR